MRFLALFLTTLLVWGQESLTLSWDTVKNASGYVLYQGVASSIFTNRIPVKTNSVILNLSPDTHYFIVSAYTVPDWEGPRSDPLVVEVAKDKIYYQFSPQTMAFQLHKNYRYTFQIFSNQSWVTTQVIIPDSDRLFLRAVPTNLFRVLRAP